MEIGRNNKCPCGSGKKFKKCHLGVRDTPVLQKIMDKGTNDDFVARILFGTFHIRDQIFHEEKERREFDKYYDPIYQNLAETQFSKDQSKKILSNHISDVESGKKSEIAHNHIKVDENIELELSLFLKDFFIRGGIALSYLVKFAKFLGFNISFIYQDDKGFEAGLKKFKEKHDNKIVDFLIERIKIQRTQWYGSFREIRNSIEHEGWVLPKIRYGLKDGKVKVIPPQFQDGITIDKGLDLLWELLLDFCEDMVVLLLSTKLPDFFALEHLPKEMRDPAQPVRYRLVPSFEITEKIRQIKQSSPTTS